MPPSLNQVAGVGLRLTRPIQSLLNQTPSRMMGTRGSGAPDPGGDKLAELRCRLTQAKRVLVLTGAGVSAESGIPTFRGATAGDWRGYSISELACMEAFERDPSQVWELYHYRREKSLAAKPNPAHLAIAGFERYCNSHGVDFMLATQNIDRLHQRAGSRKVVEIHRSLFMVRCTREACGEVADNYESPICEALRGRGDPSSQADASPIPLSQLPKCPKCSGLLRPYVVWFGESLGEGVLSSVMEFANKSNFVLVVGTTHAVYPAALIAPTARSCGAQLAEFNLDPDCRSDGVSYFFAGPCGSTLPRALPSD